MKLFVVVLCALNYSQCVSDAAKILAFVPFPAKSHYIAFEPLFKELSARGHELRVVSGFPQKIETPNLIDIRFTSDFSEMLAGNVAVPIGAAHDSFGGKARFLMEHVGPKICEELLNHTEIRRLVESEEKFDLIISEVFISDCALSFVHKFQVPYVGISSSVAMPWIPDILANPDNPSYIPHYFGCSSDRMNYWERFINALYLTVLKFGYKIYSDRLSYKIAKDRFGPDLPSFDDLRSKVGLLLVNTHHSVTSPRALAPGVKEVGGIHIPSSGPPQLPKDLQDYLDSAMEGVVYFSLGSALNVSTLPAENLAVFLRYFSELPHRVLWKCSEREMPKLPKNVKCLDWAPQLSILCKLSLFFQTLLDDTVDNGKIINNMKANVDSSPCTD